MNVDQKTIDRIEIRALIEKWAVCRDSSLWDEFRTVWHEDGIMKATWIEAPFEEFIRITEEGNSERDLNILHHVGESYIDIYNNRAVSMTRFIIAQRAVIETTLCDVTCYARHYDHWEKRKGRWGLVLRQTIADKDRIDPVRAGEVAPLDEKLLDQFPQEYRHLGYLQSKVGCDVDKNAPCQSNGKALEELYAAGKEWLREDLTQ